MKRFGYAIRTGGDTEISGALALGIEAGTSDETQQLGYEAVRRVAMRRHTPEEWAALIAEAEVIYGARRWVPLLIEWVQVGWALIWYAIDRAMHRQDAILEDR